jgi:hypothetical protein
MLHNKEAMIAEYKIFKKQRVTIFMNVLSGKEVLNLYIIQLPPCHTQNEMKIE